MNEIGSAVPQARRVGAVVVVHGSNPYLADCLDALEGQCDSVVVVDNLPGDESVALLAGRRVVVHTNPRPLSFAANVNIGIELLDTRYAAIVNPDAVADPGCVDALVGFLEGEPAAGLAAPQLRWPDGVAQPTGRSFPTISATVVRRTPLRRWWRPIDHQARHYRLDQMTETDPWTSDWLLGAFLMVRRDDFKRWGGLDEGYRMYVEDMDLCARLAGRGLSRWVVPTATAVHEYQAEIDRRFASRRNWWHAKGMVRFVRRHPAILFGSNTDA